MSDDCSSSDDSEVIWPYVCSCCQRGFTEPAEALAHRKQAGVQHCLIEAVRPAPGDHIYTVQWDEVFPGDESASVSDRATRLLQDLARLPEHHGVFVGDGGNDEEDREVVHFDGCSRGVFFAGDGKIARVSLDDFADQRRVYLRLHESPLPRPEAAYRALWALEKRGYHCQSFNCEHFASWCCTGEATSSQSWYSSVFVDPVLHFTGIPLGWACVMAKDSGHCALARCGADAEACVCGRARGHAREVVHCAEGHETCLHCLNERKAAAFPSICRSSRPEEPLCSAEADAAPEAFEEPEAEPPAEPPGVVKSTGLTRPLCCTRPCCWAPLTQAL